MSTRTSRNSKRTVAALAAIGVVASTFAIASPARADLAEVPGAGGIRLVPDTTDPNFGNQNQPAPVLQNGVDGQEAASSQILFHNGWVSGDRILVQLFDSAGANCASDATSITYSEVPDVSVAGAFEFDFTTTPWAQNDGLPGVAFGAEAPLPAEPADTTAPTFNAELIGSTGCLARGVSDILAIDFTNASSGATATDAWVFTIDGVVLDIGASVAGGPIRQVPFGQNGREGSPSYVNTVELFSGNQSALQSGFPLVVNEWTNPGFVVPIALTSEIPNALVADGFAQNLGTVTLSETQIGAFSEGWHEICFGPGISNIRGNLLTVSTSPAGVVDEDNIYSSGNCIELYIEPTAGLDEVTIDGIFGNVNTAGAKFVSLVQVPQDFTDAFLTPDDQTLGVGNYTDVNLGVLDTFRVPLGSASDLPNRIGGNDRFETAGKIAFSTVDECTDFAVLVNGNSFPDSLSSSYLAGALALSSFNNSGDEVPILTTQFDSLNLNAENAIREMGVRTVYIVGGPAAVSPAVESAVRDLTRGRCDLANSTPSTSIQVERIGGSDRYETNRDVVQRAQSIIDSDSIDYNDRIRYQANTGEASQRTVLLASGTNFADALAAGPISYGTGDGGYCYDNGDNGYYNCESFGFPLVLTDPGSLSTTASRTITNLDIERVIIVGGPAAVSPAIQAALEAQGLDVIRLQGADRYQTAIQVLLWAATPTFPNDGEILEGGDGYDLGLGWGFFGDIVLARGDDFADALAVAPYVADRQEYLVLTPPTTLDPAAAFFIEAITDVRDGFSEAFGVDFGRPSVIAIGLGQAISTSVLNEANALANP